MTTAWDQLTSNSSIQNGTAWDHLLAQNTGEGSGGLYIQNEGVYVSVDEPLIVELTEFEEITIDVVELEILVDMNTLFAEVT